MPGLARESWVWVHESFAGKEIDTPWFSFGYAKANPYAHDGLPQVPQTIPDKANLLQRHGAPPFVGSEHDEDDGYRINWNLGSEYDDRAPISSRRTIETTKTPRT